MDIYLKCVPFVIFSAIYFDSSKNEFSRQNQEGTRAYENKNFVSWADINYAPGLYCSEILAFLF